MDVEGLVIEWAVEPGDVVVLQPIDRFRGNGAEIVLCLCPGAPRGILETRAVGNVASAHDNVAPACGNIGLFPIVGEVVDVTGGLVGENRVVVDSSQVRGASVGRWRGGRGGCGGDY